MERKTVLILGGSSGIGKSAAQRFAKEGWQVVVASSSSEKVNSVVSTLYGEGHLGMKVDVRDIGHIRQLARKLKEIYGRFHVLVNSIGVSQGGTILDSCFDHWNDSLQIMLYGTVHSCRELLPLMVDGGRVIHITSIHHERVEQGSSAYGMAKAAITQFTRSLALELAPRGILANTVAPGFIDTPMSVKVDGRSELESEWFKDNYVKYDHLPLRRAGRPEEVAGVVYFLAGLDASYITGSVLTVDGGLTITF
ncbi:SDR family NAD(P)-dependent oxidoreductase [Sphingobacterium pedocola]|uniref:Oxidoreductase n=1 Tax=Sphingobacterium pedocola TaxID=2082722 RepID=A0ABR9TAT6_9SPHI|nr:SDR family oxidoreductase [Sphingobacterium pedocola]MBE8721989.1 oxidoreductase [Sphingobacterium pedocola]